MIISKLCFLRKFSSASNKPFYVTTPIFYVNASPHIGHLYSVVISDAICRYNEIKNPSVSTKLATGTDEHGTKIQQAATKNNVPVHEYCDSISSSYRHMFDLGSIKYTDFIRTTENRHKLAVQYFWEKLKKKDDCIYKTTYGGWYCVSDETFLTDSQLKENPDGSRVSLESGHTVDWTEEVNYMFKLSKFQEDVLYWVKKGDRIKPVKFEKVLLDYLNEPLPDVSISRPISRVHWGIKVPDDKTQTVYVWLDALVNYLTCAGYPDKKFNEYWPPALHVIGKDILKFHGIYWPAFLIAAGLEPPQKLLVHSHWTVDGQKMSKSKLNVVDPIERSRLCTMEGLRYFLLREGVPHSDGNFSDIKLLRILNSELADTIGNLLSRACAKSLNPRQVFPKFHSEEFEELIKEDSAKRLIDVLNELPDKCSHHYDSYNFYLVVDQVIAVLHAANNFFESSKPWELKSKNQSDKEKSNYRNDALMPDSCRGSSAHIANVLKLETIITITMETLRVCAIILQPIIPIFAGKLLDKLKVDSTQRYWANTNQRSWDTKAGNRLTDTDLNELDPILFRRIISDVDKAKKLKKPSKT